MAWWQPREQQRVAAERPRSRGVVSTVGRPVSRLTITFDNGPTPGVTDRVLATLLSRGIKSTFFLVGEKLVAAGARDLAVAAHEQGHWIGNHTMHHGPPLGEWDDADGACAEIALAQEALGALAHPRRLF